jgi:hypothetical protein
LFTSATNSTNAITNAITNATTKTSLTAAFRTNRASIIAVGTR